MHLKVFIVEDHPVMREMLTTYLEDQPNVNVCGVASTGADALEKMEESDADLVIIDVSLPDMDGIAVVSELREQGIDLPCVMLSGHGESSYVQRAFSAGASGYLLKGDPDEIMLAIESVMESGTYVGDSLKKPKTV